VKRASGAGKARKARNAGRRDEREVWEERGECLELEMEDEHMPGAVKMEVKSEAVIQAVKKMRKADRDAFLEELLAATSPEYLKSIKEAREQYKARRIMSHEEVFGR
jgi:hypothetical protein